MTVHSLLASEETFRPYGMLVKSPAGTPTSSGPDYRFWSDLARYTVNGETEIGVCVVYRQPAAEIRGVERHHDTPEILIPIDAPFVVPLMLDGQPDSALTAFQVNIGEAVVIDPDVWHGACLPVRADQSSYFVIFRRGTPHADFEKKTIAPVVIAIGG